MRHLKTFLAVVASVLAFSLSVEAVAADTEAESGAAKASGKVTRGYGMSDGWFVSVGGGAQIYFGEHDRKIPLGDRLAPALDVAVGKWFTPVFGARVMYSGLQARGATKLLSSQEGTAHGTGKVPSSSKYATHRLQQSKFSLMNLHADALFNASEFVFGWHGDYVWQCSPYAGIGLAHVFDTPKESSYSLNLGIFNAFRISDSFDINLDLRGVIVNQKLDGETGGRSGEGILDLTVGVSYKF